MLRTLSVVLVSAALSALRWACVPILKATLRGAELAELVFCVFCVFCVFSELRAFCAFCAGRSDDVPPEVKGDTK